MPELQDLPVPDAGVGEDAKFDSGTDNGVGPASQHRLLKQHKQPMTAVMQTVS